jgi:hypothetical protein
MFGTNRQFDLTRLPFSVRGAFLLVYNDFADDRPYFSRCRGLESIK